MTEEEKEGVQQRQADAAARATRWERPPSPTRPSIKRACKAELRAS